VKSGPAAATGDALDWPPGADAAELDAVPVAVPGSGAGAARVGERDGSDPPARSISARAQPVATTPPMNPPATRTSGRMTRRNMIS
jgi:hypothetical protein